MYPDPQDIMSVSFVTTSLPSGQQVSTRRSSMLSQTLSVLSMSLASLTRLSHVHSFVTGVVPSTMMPPGQAVHGSSAGGGRAARGLAAVSVGQQEVEPVDAHGAAVGLAGTLEDENTV